MLRHLRLHTLFALAATIAVGVLAGCGSSEKSGGSAGTKSEDPAALLKKAFAAHPTSGELKLKLGLDAKGSGKVSGPVSFKLAGPFKSRGKNKLPLLDWDISVSGAGQNLSGGVVATEDNAYVKFRGQTYEVGAQAYKQFLRRQERQSKAGPQNVTDLGIDPSKWLTGAKVGDGRRIGGSATRQVTGKIDVRRMVDDIVKALQSPELRKQFKGTGRPVPDVSNADKQKVIDAVKDATLKVNVDDDDVARRVAFSATFHVPGDVNARGLSGGTVAFEYELPQVNEKVSITAPSDAKPLALLLQQLGLGAGLPGGKLRTQ